MKIKLLFLISLALFAPRAGALSLLHYPEIAEQHSMFVDVKAVRVGFEYAVPAIGGRFDYLLPFGFPVSLGVFLEAPDPNLKNFGLRAAYHIDLNSRKIDLYFLYNFDFGFLRNAELKSHNDTEQPVNYYDFRIGMRYMFGLSMGITVETDYKLTGVNIALAIKIN
jgi:hypothetical protein